MTLNVEALYDLWSKKALVDEGLRSVFGEHGPNGEVLSQWVDLSGQSRREAGLVFGMTKNAVHGRIWRYRQKTKPRPELFANLLPKPLALEGDWMIVGDVQCPTVDYDFAQMPAMIAEKHLSDPRGLLIAGDLLNLDAWSDHDNIIKVEDWIRERAATRHLLEEWSDVFAVIILLLGNHEHRLLKRNNGNLDYEDLETMLQPISGKLKVSPFSWCTIETATGIWRITHPGNYSVNQLVVADVLAQKFDCHIIAHHGHHLAKGMDRYKRRVVVDNGGLFDERKMAYVQMVDKKSAGMARGFTMLRDGIAHLFGEPKGFTDWDYWLNGNSRNGK